MEKFDNPFSDSSVQTARGSTTQPAEAAEFNPFAPKQQATAQPAMLPSGTQQQPPPPYTSSAQQRITSEELDRKQRELEARAREIDRMEEEQRRRGTGGTAPATRGANNWPPLPSFCPVGPCFYQDFDLEIPAEHRKLVKTGYYLWIAHLTLLLVNIIGALTYFIVVQPSDAVTSGTVFGMSLLFGIILPPCSFVCWFRPLYKAFRSDSSFNFFFFFLICIIQTGVLIVQCLGINYLGSCGWINASATTKINTGAGVFMLVIAALFTAMAVADIVLLLQVHRIYRSSGASFAKARQELQRGVASNEAVRGAAASAAATTFSAMASSSASAASSGSGGRY